MGVIRDYRCNEFDFVDFTIDTQKRDFMELFRNKHPRAQNIYSYVKNRKYIFNEPFRAIYHYRCAYCGVSTSIITSSQYEVDHVIAQANFGDTGNVNSIDNIVSSCKLCNGNKSDFDFNAKSLELIHPDRNKLPEVFVRNAMYYIEVAPKYKNNDSIKAFYDTMQFNSELRRLDYLLMELKEFCLKYEGDKIADSIYSVIRDREQYRRDKY